MPSIKEQLSKKIEKIEQTIDFYLPEEKGLQKTVLSAMNYSVKAGGKRLRPMLMAETYEMFGGADSSVIEPFMAAIEMIHTYSLIHDDLPALDNDALRRGMPTAHIKFGEAMAILAGDALLNYAFETAAKAFDGTNKDIQTAKALQILTRKPGIYGMIGGQTVDVEQENKAISFDTLMYIHNNKTAALIECAMMIGAVLAGASEKEVSMIEMDVKTEWIGKTLIELNLRKKYGINVVAARKGNIFLTTIEPTLSLEKGMQLIVIAEISKIQKLK